MREIEPWLWETGWGCDILGVEDPETHIAEGSQGQHQPNIAPVGDEPDPEEESDSDEPDEGDAEEDGLHPELDEQDEDEMFEDEDTVEGKFGYSIF